MIRNNRKVCNIIITNHAFQRWRERGGKGKLTIAKVRRKLLALLPVGFEVRYEAIEVPLGNDLYAVLRPELAGYWVVVSIIRPGEYLQDVNNDAKEEI